MIRQLSAPELIGRHGELAMLRQALARAASGIPAAVLVTGEAGVGKTRLVREFYEQARGEGVPVWVGNCAPVADGLAPYWPIGAILRAMTRDLGADRLRALAGRAASPLALLVPELAEGDPATGSAVEPAPFAPLHPVLMALFERLGGEPTVLVVEDLHWADPSTLGLMAALVSGLRQGRLLLVGTSRDDEVRPDHPIHGLLVELGRAGAERIPLARLDLAETRAQIASIQGTDPDPAAANRIFARSGGNPFLVEELLAVGTHSDALPTSVREVLRVRLSRLPAASVGVLRTVALCGGSADHDLLERLVGADVLVAVRAAVEEHLLNAECDRYVYRHALVAEAVTAEMLPGERQLLHRELAAALAARVPAGGPGNRMTAALASALAEVAAHWLAAGETGQALTATVTAALAAEEASALAEARQHFTRAIQLWWPAPAEHRERAQLDIVDLYIHAADAANQTGDVEGALALVDAAISIVDAEQDALRAGNLHLQLGGFLQASAAATRAAIAAFETAVELVPDKPSPQRAAALIGLADVLMADLRQDEASSWAEQALLIAQQVGARVEESAALTILGLDLVRRAEVDRGLTQLRRALEISDRFGTPHDQFQAHRRLADALLSTGRYREAHDVARRGMEQAERTGTADTFGALLRGYAGEALVWLGRWTEVEKPPPDGTPAGYPIADFVAWLNAANVHTAQGRHEVAQRFLDRCHHAVAAGITAEPTSLSHLAQAELCLWRSEPAAARDWAGRTLDLLGTSQHLELTARALATACRAEADLARLHGGRRSGTNVPVRPAALADLVARHPARGSNTAAAAHLALADAELARTGISDTRAGGSTATDTAQVRTRGTNAKSVAWADAAAVWERFECPYQLAYARWRQAEAVLTARSGRGGAQRLVTEAWDLAAGLDAVPLRREIEGLASRAGLGLGAAGPPPDTAERGGLTPRELQVLTLIAEGASNRQIARTLFIAENTVSIHVSRVLAKLEVGSRSAAAAAARKRGLIAR